MGERESGDRMLEGRLEVGGRNEPILTFYFQMWTNARKGSRTIVARTRIVPMRLDHTTAPVWKVSSATDLFVKVQ